MVREAVEQNKRRFAAGDAAEAASVYALDHLQRATKPESHPWSTRP